MNSNDVLARFGIIKTLLSFSFKNRKVDGKNDFISVYDYTQIFSESGIVDISQLRLWQIELSWFLMRWRLKRKWNERARLCVSRQRDNQEK